MTKEKTKRITFPAYAICCYKGGLDVPEDIIKNKKAVRKYILENMQKVEVIEAEDNWWVDDLDEPLVSEEYFEFDVEEE